MSVYMSPLYKTKITKDWPHEWCCEMIADKLSELNAMIELLGIDPFKVKWEGDLAYVKVNRIQRETAVNNGAHMSTEEYFTMKTTKLRGDKKLVDFKT